MARPLSEKKMHAKRSCVDATFGLKRLKITTVAHYEAEILMSHDYGCFGNSLSEDRGFASESYRYGFNGKEMDNEIAGEGNSYDFGARIYDPRLGRWASVDPLGMKYPNESPYCFVGNSPIIMIDPDGKEKIVVVGAQHDNSAANKLMFVHQAIKQINEYKTQLKAANSNEIVTMIIMKEGYTAKQLARLQKHATKNGYNLVVANSSEEVTNYLNSTYTEVGSQDFIGSSLRQFDPITALDFFSHGLPGSIELGYETKMADSYRFDEQDVAKLSSMIFAPNALISSYACRTGITFTGEDASYDPSTMTMEAYMSLLGVDNSLAQKIANQTNRNVNAYFVRTDYSGTLGTSWDRFARKLGIDGGWLDKHISNQETVDGAVFDPDGAYNPVEGGMTPMGANRQKQLFKPK